MRNLFLALVLCACGYDSSIEGGDAADDAHLGIRKGQGQVVDPGNDAGEAQGGQTGGTISTGGLPNTGGAQTGGTSTGGVQNASGGAPGSGGVAPCVPVPVAEEFNGKDDDCDGEVDDGIAGVKRYGGSTYFFGSDAYKAEALTFCKDKGYDSVTVSNSDENDFIASNIVHPNGSYWLGLTDREAEAVWAWDDLAQSEYFSWGAGQPNDCDRTNASGVFDPLLPCGPEDCVIVGQTGKWKDFSCDRQKSKVLCELRLERGISK